MKGDKGSENEGEWTRRNALNTIGTVAAGVAGITIAAPSLLAAAREEVTASVLT